MHTIINYLQVTDYTKYTIDVGILVDAQSSFLLVYINTFQMYNNKFLFLMPINLPFNTVR